MKEEYKVNLAKELEETTRLMNKYIKECIDKDNRIAVLERALELACEEIELNKQGKTKGTLALQKIINEFGIGKELSDKEYFIEQAEKEFEEEE